VRNAGDVAVKRIWLLMVSLLRTVLGSVAMPHSRSVDAAYPRAAMLPNRLLLDTTIVLTRGNQNERQCSNVSYESLLC
jgi:hypothetical protein